MTLTFFFSTCCRLSKKDLAGMLEHTERRRSLCSGRLDPRTYEDGPVRQVKITHDSNKLVLKFKYYSGQTSYST